MLSILDYKTKFFYTGELKKGIELFTEPVEGAAELTVEPYNVACYNDKYYLLSAEKKDWFQKSRRAKTKYGIGEIVEVSDNFAVVELLSGQRKNFYKKSIEPVVSTNELFYGALAEWDDIRQSVIDEQRFETEIKIKELIKSVLGEPSEKEPNIEATSFNLKQPKVEQPKVTPPAPAASFSQTQKFVPRANKVVEKGNHVNSLPHEFSLKNQMPHFTNTPPGKVFDASAINSNEDFKKLGLGNYTWGDNRLKELQGREKHDSLMHDIYHKVHKQNFPELYKDKKGNPKTPEDFELSSMNHGINRYNEATYHKINEHLHKLGYDYIKHPDHIQHGDKTHDFYTATHEAAPIHSSEAKKGILQQLKEKLRFGKQFTEKKWNNPVYKDMTTGETMDLTKVPHNFNKDYHLTHISLNKNSKSEADRFNYHYIKNGEFSKTHDYMDQQGVNSSMVPEHLKGKVYVPGESVEYQGKVYNVKSHIDPYPRKNLNNLPDDSKMLITDNEGNNLSVPRNEVKLVGPDFTKSKMVELEDGSKKFHHDLQVGDKIKNFGRSDEVVYKDNKGYLTFNPKTQTLYHTFVPDYDKEYKSTHFDKNKYAEQGDEIQFTHNGTSKVRPVIETTDKGAVVKVNKTDEPILIKHGQYRYTGNKEHERFRGDAENNVLTSNPNDPTMSLDELKKKLLETEEYKGQHFENHLNKLNKLAGTDNNPDAVRKIDDNTFEHKLGIGNAKIVTTYDPESGDYESKYGDNQFSMGDNLYEIVPPPAEEVKKGTAKNVLDHNTVYVRNLDKNSKPQAWDIDNLKRVIKKDEDTQLGKMQKEEDDLKAKSEKQKLQEQQKKEKEPLGYEDHVKTLDSKFGSSEKDGDSVIHNLGLGEAKIKSSKNGDNVSTEIVNPQVQAGDKQYTIAGYDPKTDEVKYREFGSLKDNKPVKLDQFKEHLLFHQKSAEEENQPVQTDNKGSIEDYVNSANKNLGVDKQPHRYEQGKDGSHLHSLGLGDVKVKSSASEDGNFKTEILNPHINVAGKKYKVVGYDPSTNEVTVKDKANIFSKPKKTDLNDFKEWAKDQESIRDEKQKAKDKESGRETVTTNKKSQEELTGNLHEKLAEAAFLNGAKSADDLLVNEGILKKTQKELNDYHKDLNAGNRGESVVEPENYKPIEKFNLKENGEKDLERALGEGWKDKLNTAIQNKIKYNEEYQKNEAKRVEEDKIKNQTRREQNEVVQRNKDLAEKNLKEYTDNTYNKLPSVVENSLNHKLGIYGDEKKMRFKMANSPDHNNLPFEYHIINRKDVIPSHLPHDKHFHSQRQPIGNKEAINYPMHINEKYPPHEDSNTQLRAYHDKTDVGKNARQFIFDQQADNYSPEIKHSRTTQGDAGTAVLGAKGEIMGGNGGELGQRVMSDEQKKENYEDLKSQLRMFYPQASDEQIKQLKDSMDKSYEETGEYPEIYRVAKTKNGEYYDFGKHTDYPAFTKYLNDPNLKYQSEEAQRKAVEAVATPEIRKEFFDLIPRGQTINKFKGNAANAKKLIDKAVQLKIIPEHNYGEYFNNNVPTAKGKNFMDMMLTGGYFKPETNEFIKNLPASLRQKVENIKGNHIEDLADIQRNYPFYDLSPALEEYIKDIASDNKQMQGQESILDKPDRVKGLHYMFGLPVEHQGEGEKGQKDILDEYRNSVKKLTDNLDTKADQTDIFGEVNPKAKLSAKEYMDDFFKQYAKLYDLEQKYKSKNKNFFGKSYTLIVKNELHLFK